MRKPLLLALLLLGLISASKVRGAAQTPPSGTHDWLSLVRELQTVAPGLVSQKGTGGAMSVTIPPAYANDRNLTILASVSNLTALTVVLRPHIGSLTKHGFAAFEGSTSLTTLTLECGLKLEPGVLAGVCKVRSLRRLKINLATPPSSEYPQLTNLTRLHELQLYGVGNFSCNDLMRLSTLPNLQRFVVSQAELPPSDWSNILNTFPALTNAVMWKDGKAVTWERPHRNETEKP